MPYQTQINQALRKVIESDGQIDVEELKKKLLADPEFLRKLASHIRAA
ncbi:MAG: hypothetical protein AABY83_03190 [Pseudomonadota bacterium]